jgi:hypothetical protein
VVVRDDFYLVRSAAQVVSPLRERRDHGEHF